MQQRKQLITNLYIKPKDIKKLANGYVVYKRGNKHAHALIPKAQVDNNAKANILVKKIEKLNKMLNKLGMTGIIAPALPTPRIKQKYTKKNLAYWSKGGNITTAWNGKKKSDMGQTQQ